jgi:hypothetical protein
MKTRAFAAIAAIVFLLSCAQDTISRERWKAMSSDDRVLYVNTLIGGEKAKDAKGDRGLPVTRTPEEYVKQIDEAYTRGEARPVHEVFAELAR